MRDRFNRTTVLAKGGGRAGCRVNYVPCGAVVRQLKLCTEQGFYVLALVICLYHGIHRRKSIVQVTPAPLPLRHVTTAKAHGPTPIQNNCGRKQQIFYRLPYCVPGPAVFLLANEAGKHWRTWAVRDLPHSSPNLSTPRVARANCVEQRGTGVIMIV